MTQPAKTTQAILRFAEPDLSVPAKDRALFALAANKIVREDTVALNDFRTDERVVKGPEGLDVQGFTYLNHRSALQNSDQWFSGLNVEDIYLPELCDLICKITGAQTAVVNNVAFRRRLADKQADLSYVHKRGDELDREIAKLPRDKTLGTCFFFLSSHKVGVNTG